MLLESAPITVLKDLSIPQAQRLLNYISSRLRSCAFCLDACREEIDRVDGLFEACWRQFKVDLRWKASPQYPPPKDSPTPQIATWWIPGEGTIAPQNLSVSDLLDAWSHEDQELWAPWHFHKIAIHPWDDQRMLPFVESYKIMEERMLSAETEMRSAMEAMDVFKSSCDRLPEGLRRKLVRTPPQSPKSPWGPGTGWGSPLGPMTSSWDNSGSTFQAAPEDTVDRMDEEEVIEQLDRVELVD
ncbi:hypothetical protein CC1G_14519 [Coprinopsis cinerea okayama7|uniref:Uncharacterized protein n=1 Tax=Coprinopsis cinerea (strain Okayama-7 / 130 / ATCC MYA-4618 / FGSC 9003) TaxID=240176 RepID=A8NW50_COPC7|nr:hypothetical protein CC1G_14519 [Coprinopsis cinerea okayama7\|eukprot:XP_001836829.1 hypothetical protein CC1G_14519 [Coprinopsis cinerea okayama7\